MKPPGRKMTGHESVQYFVCSKCRIYSLVVTKFLDVAYITKDQRVLYDIVMTLPSVQWGAVAS